MLFIASYCGLRVVKADHLSCSTTYSHDVQHLGYCWPVFRLKWELPLSDSTCRILNKIFSFSAITNASIGVGGSWGRAGGQGTVFFDALAKSRESLSIGLVGERFLLKTHQLIKYSPFCYFQTKTLMQNPMHTFHPCVLKIISDIFVWAWHAQEKSVIFSSMGRVCPAHETNGDFLGCSVWRSSLDLPVQTKIFVIMQFTWYSLKYQLSYYNSIHCLLCYL